MPKLFVDLLQHSSGVASYPSKLMRSLFGLPQQQASPAPALEVPGAFSAIQNMLGAQGKEAGAASGGAITGAGMGDQMGLNDAFQSLSGAGGMGDEDGAGMMVPDYGSGLTYF